MQEKSKNLFIGIAVAIGLIFVVVLMTDETKNADYNYNYATESSVKKIKVNSEEGGYSWEFIETAFLAGCNGEGAGLEDYCDCAFAYIKQNYTTKEFTDINEELLVTGSMPKELMVNVVTKCAGEIKY